MARRAFVPNEVIHFNCGITAIILERRNGTVMFTFINTTRYPEVKDYRWCAHRSDLETFYARTNQRGTNVTMVMHRLLTGFQFDEVDHKDGNGLNNLDDNLRDAQGRNQQNVGLTASNKTGIKGASFHSGGYQVHIHVGHTKKYLGWTKDPQKARDLYDAAAIQYFGPFARTNQMLERRTA